MITIRHTVHEHNGILEIQGHANSAEFGRDVVCAGVSAIATTLALILKEENASVRVASGNTSIVYPFSEQIAPHIQFALTGFRWMAETFPEFISLQEESQS